VTHGVGRKTGLQRFQLCKRPFIVDIPSV
jgi:hypothetical protein